jgi:DNA-binding SARP family transcriptional activator/ABC-type branched-subunit amino acid transport system substrate-binding protein
MQFRLLGPLEVADDHGPVRITPGKESALLALLLLHAREILAVDEIVEELWGPAAPSNARKQVQIHVSHLRKALGAERIVTTPGGYRLDAEDEELDVRRFESAAQAGRPRDALSEWRGAALADFRYSGFAQGEARRLEELRDLARAELVDEALARGDANAVIPELEAEIRRNPLHERPRGQLMRALYLAGRQADALDAYHDARTVLERELGVEPSPDLRALEHAILNHDPALGSPRAPRGPSRRRPVRLIVAGCLICALAAAMLAFALTRSDSAASLPYVPDSLIRLDGAGDRVDATLPIAGAPGAVAAHAGRVWVGSTSGNVSEIVPKAMRARAAVTLAGAPEQLVATRSHVWAVVGGVIAGVDPAYDKIRVRIAVPGKRPASVRIAPAPEGGLWVVDGSRILRRYGEDGHAQGSLRASVPLTDIAAGERKLWALSSTNATLLELDPRTGRSLGAIPLELRHGQAAPAPFAVSAGSGGVWVLEGGPPSVVRVDPRLVAVTNTIPLGIGSDPLAIKVGAGAVWVADSGDGTLARIDPSTLALRRINVGGSPADVVATSSSHVWATVHAGLDANTGGVPAPLAATARDALPSSLCSPVYGDGTPDVLLAADLPLQGFGGDSVTLQMSNAIRFVLAQHHFRAGRWTVGYQLCDDSSAQVGGWTPATCAATARAISQASSVVAVIGPFNSGCAQTELPILAHSRSGTVTELSPSATYVGLTHHGPGTEPREPALYRAHGAPIFFRNVAADDAQGAANAVLAHRLGVRRLFLLLDGSAYSRGLTSAAAAVAARVGVGVVGTLTWQSSGNLAKVARAVARRRADGVFLAGAIDEGGIALIQDLRHALGPRAHILLSDGFTPFPVLLRTGPAAEGATVTIAVPALSRLPLAGKRFASRFSRAIGTRPEPYSIAAAEAAEVVLAAIARSDGTRSSVRHQLRTQPVVNGILGNFRFDANGDTTRAIVSVYEITRGRASLRTTITPPPLGR